MSRYFSFYALELDDCIYTIPIELGFIDEKKEIKPVRSLLSCSVSTPRNGPPSLLIDRFFMRDEQWNEAI